MKMDLPKLLKETVLLRLPKSKDLKQEDKDKTKIDIVNYLLFLFYSY